MVGCYDLRLRTDPGDGLPVVALSFSLASNDLAHAL